MLVASGASMLLAAVTDADKEHEMTQPVSQSPALQPAAVSKDEGEAYWWSEALAVVKAGAADTGVQMTILDVTEPPNTVAPLHVHHREDEAFWILEGSATRDPHAPGRRPAVNLPSRRWVTRRP